MSIKKFLLDVDSNLAAIVQILFTEKCYGSADVSAVYSKRKFWAFRALAAGSPVTRLEDLLRLLEDKEGTVVEQLAWNRELPDYIASTMKERALSGVYDASVSNTVLYALENKSPLL